MIRAASVGDNCVDVYTGESVQRLPGGNAVNVAVAMAHAGIDSAYVGIIGDDAEGAALRQALVDRNVDTSLVAIKPGRTARTDIEVRNGERHFTGEDGGVQTPLVLDPLTLQKITAYQWVHFSAFSNWKGGCARYQPNLAEELHFLKRYGIRMSVDFGEPADWEQVPREIAHFLDVSFFSMPSQPVHEAVALGKKLQIQWGGIAVVTMGEQGSLVVSKLGDVWPIDAVKVDVIDTCGAGDAYIGTFLANLSLNRSLFESAQAASKMAASVCLQTGAWPLKRFPSETKS